MQNKERVLWVDICKGVLITLLMFSHLVWVAKSHYNINNVLINYLARYDEIWACFFMSCFFVLSGMFSNYNKSANDFIISNLKSLLFPALVSLFLFDLPNLNFTNFIEMALLYGGGLWFLTSLFLSKLFLWCCIKWVKNKWIVIVLLLALSFLGKILDGMNVCPNYWYHRNFLNFSLFLGVGYYFKEFILYKKVGVVSVIAFILTLIPFFVTGTQIPYVVSIYSETLLQHPLTIWLSITGSISCIYMCMVIKHNSVLEFLGRNSLIVYIYHMFILSECILFLTPTLNENTLRGSLVSVFMIIVSTLVFCSGVAVALNTKYLKWMKGSF